MSCSSSQCCDRFPKNGWCCQTRYEDQASWLDELEDSQFDFETVTEFANNLSEEIDPEGDLLSRMEDAYVGQYYDEATFAEEVITECYDLDQLPGIIANHIDWQAVWDCELRFDYYVVGVDLFFSNN